MLLFVLYTFCVYVVTFKCMYLCYYVCMCFFVCGSCPWQKSKQIPLKTECGYFMKVKNNKHNFLLIIRYK